jgi:cytochrome P450
MQSLITLSTRKAVDAALRDPRLEPPPPPPSIGHGATAMLRASMARFSSGDDHIRRRVEIERALDGLEPKVVMATAFEIASRLFVVESEVDAVTDLGCGVPTETMLTMLGVGGDRSVLAGDVRAVAEVIGRGAVASDSSDAAVERLLDACADIGCDPVAVVSALYQTYDATAALVIETILARHRQSVRKPAVTQTRRVASADTAIGGVSISSGTDVLLDLAESGFEFGAGRHCCPGRAIAEAIVDGIIAAMDFAGIVVHDIPAVVDGARPTSMLLARLP